MSRGFPSMTALLGLLAVAGYQNRDKIAEMLGGIGQSAPAGTGQSGIGGLLGQLSRSFAGASAGGLLRACECLVRRSYWFAAGIEDGTRHRLGCRAGLISHTGP